MALKKAAWVLAIVVLCGVAFVLLAASRLSAPVPMAIGPPPSDLDAREVSFDDVRGWFAPASDAKAVVVLLPGIRANRLSMIDRARFLRRAGYSALLIDLQATGETPGKHITFGWLESRNAAAAVAFARKEAPGLPVIILGSSLGGAAALLAQPPLRVDGMILEAVYPTVETAAANRLRMRLGRAGSLAAPLLLWQLKPRLGVSASALRPVDRIDDAGCPVLIIGGTRDRHTTPADTRLLFERAREPKELWLVEGAAHVDFHRARRAEYERRVLAFLERATR